MLTGLGFLQHPPLEKIIEIAGSDDLKIRRAAYAYFSKKFDELYDKDYDPSCCAGKPFIPALKDDVECVGTHEEVRSRRYFIGIFIAEAERTPQGLF